MASNLILSAALPDGSADKDLLYWDGSAWVVGDRSTAEVAGVSDVQTLTNKTLKSMTNDVHANVVHAFGFNSTGSTISAGTPVYLSGWNAGADRYTIAPADASNAALMPAAGIAENDIPHGSVGMLVKLGPVEGLDTSAYSVGDDLYVAAGGGLTATKPTGTNLVQKIGQVTRSNVGTGALSVSGANRSNDLPNLAANKLWVGDSNGVPQEAVGLEFDGTSLTVPAASAATPSIQFPSGGGFYDYGSGSVGVSANGVPYYAWGSTALVGLTTGGTLTACMMRAQASLTTPGFVPRWPDVNSGLGGDGNDSVSLISGGKNVLQADGSGATNVASVFGDLKLVETAGVNEATFAVDSSGNLSIISSSGGIDIDYDNLPSSDPGVKGRIYRDASNVLYVSSGV